MAAAALGLEQALRLASIVLLVGCTEAEVVPIDLGEPVPDACTGSLPPAEAWSDEPSGDGLPPTGGPLIGAPPATFALRDFQPQSCGYDAVYGLDVLRGRVTLLVAVESS